MRPFMGLKPRRIDHRAAVAMDGDQACFAEAVEVKRQGVWSKTLSLSNT